MPTTPAQPIDQEFTNDEPRVTEQAAGLTSPENSNSPLPTPQSEAPMPGMTLEAPVIVPEGGATLPEGVREVEAQGEAVPETSAEAPVAQALEGLRARLHRPKTAKASTVPQVRDTMSLQVEKIMEAGLGDAFQALTPVQKQEFKIKGEETARKIRDLLRDAHVKVKKIFRLILEWLRLLPGVNRFFLEQEAKIKADKIIALKHYD